MRITRRFLTPGLLGGDMGTGSSLGAGPIPHRDSVGRLPNNFDFNMNIIETKKGYEFTADLPGLSKDMVNVELDTDNDMLMISAERAERHEEVRPPEDFRDVTESRGTFLVHEIHPDVPVCVASAHVARTDATVHIPPSLPPSLPPSRSHSR